MRILIITNDYGRVPVGGIGVHTEYLVHNLVRHLEVAVVRVPFEGPDDLVAHGPGEDPQATPGVLLGHVPAGDAGITGTRAADEVGEYVAAFDPDVVHAQDVGPYLAGRQLAARLGRPFVFTAHCVEASRRLGIVDGNDRLVDRLRLQALRTAGAALAVSDFLRDELVTTFGPQVARTRSLRLPLDPSHVRNLAEKGQACQEAADVESWLDGSPYLVFLGRLSPEKRPELLLEVFAELVTRADHHDHRLVIVGGGRLHTRLAELADELGVGSRTRLCGRAPHDASLAILDNSDGLVFPSTYESAGIAGVEALALGKRIVATDLPGIREHLGRVESVRLLPFHADAATWADALVDVAHVTPSESFPSHLEPRALTAAMVEVYKSSSTAVRR